jgi:hypothetical protein
LRATTLREAVWLIRVRRVCVTPAQLKGDDVKYAVPAQVVGRPESVAHEAWRQMDNNTKAKRGKALFLELPGALRRDG